MAIVSQRSVDLRKDKDSIMPSAFGIIESEVSYPKKSQKDFFLPCLCFFSFPKKKWKKNFH